jgi:hypothetical protein
LSHTTDQRIPSTLKAEEASAEIEGPLLKKNKLERLVVGFTSLRSYTMVSNLLVNILSNRQYLQLIDMIERDNSTHTSSSEASATAKHYFSSSAAAPSSSSSSSSPRNVSGGESTTLRHKCSRNYYIWLFPG